MKVVIDGRWLGRTGIGRYTEELLDQLQQLDRTTEYLVLLLPKYYDTWRPASPNFRPVRTTSEVYTWQEQILLLWQIWRLHPDLVHFTSFNLPVFYPGRFVVTVHDLTLVNFKNVRGQGLKKVLYEFKYRIMRFVLSSAVRGASRIIVPVEYVREELGKLFPAAEKNIVVTYEAVSPSFAKPEDIERFHLPQRFLLYVGNYYPYKNVVRLVEAFGRTQAHKAGVKLVLNGKTDYFQGEVRDKVRELKLADEVIFPGRTSDGELAALYERAAIFVFPSLSEGFGLPGLEAMAQGTPVLAARASCLPEVYGEAAAYFDPYDTDDIATQIDNLLEDAERRQALSEAGKAHLTQFSWRKMAEATLKVYQEADGR